MNLSATAQKMATPDKQATAFYEKAMKSINPKYIKIVEKAAASIRQDVVDGGALKASLKNNSILGSMPEGDIEAMCFFVLMEASKSAQEDLKAIMDGVKKINEEKKAMRERIRKQQAASAAAFKTAYKPTDDIAMTEMSEMEQLRLQMVMERQNHMYTTISNIMKKISDTQSTIINNLK